jgi:type IV secretion system protein VirB10
MDERPAGIISVETKRFGIDLWKLLVLLVISCLGFFAVYLTWSPSSQKEEEREQGNVSISSENREVHSQKVFVAKKVNSEKRDESLEKGIHSPLIAFSADLSKRSAASSQEGVQASLLEDLNMIIPQGTQIPCILQTALSSDQPGFVSCIVQHDVLSASGQVILMDKGTSVVGEYNGKLNQGQNRIFVLWKRARTPSGVIVNLGSPASDSLGRSGFDGDVNTHFWNRFSEAILVSIVSDVTEYILKRETPSFIVGNVVDIPPTLYKNQGELVSIFVAKDLDFSKVYRLRTKK